MASGFRWLLFTILLATQAQAELPSAPIAHDAASEADERAEQDSINGSPNPSLVSEDGNIRIARWSLSAYAIHDPKKGWGASGRIDYRLNNRWGIAATQVNTVTSGGITVRLGAIHK